MFSRLVSRLALAELFFRLRSRLAFFFGVGAARVGWRWRGLPWLRFWLLALGWWLGLVLRIGWGLSGWCWPGIGCLVFGKFCEKNFLIFFRCPFPGPLFGDCNGVFRLEAAPVFGRENFLKKMRFVFVAFFEKNVRRFCRVF